MIEYTDYEPVLAVIEAGIDKALKNPKLDEPIASDDAKLRDRFCSSNLPGAK